MSVSGTYKATSLSVNTGCFLPVEVSLASSLSLLGIEVKTIQLDNASYSGYISCGPTSLGAF